LKAELLETQERGYALDRGENEEGSRCIGAPIFNQDGEVIAAISVAAPASRLTASMEAEVALEVIRAADLISGRLGYVPPAPNTADFSFSPDYS
jgi:IclR family acetate operon transcriptional repressor